jgi:hypothetical protein
LHRLLIQRIGNQQPLVPAECRFQLIMLDVLTSQALADLAPGAQDPLTNGDRPVLVALLDEWFTAIELSRLL